MRFFFQEVQVGTDQDGQKNAPGVDKDAAEKPPKKKSKAKEDESEKELISNVSKCISNVEDYIKEKKEPSKPQYESINHQWAVTVAHKLDRFDDMQAEELRYEMDGVIMRALRDKIRSEKHDG